MALPVAPQFPDEWSVQTAYAKRVNIVQAPTTKPLSTPTTKCRPNTIPFISGMICLYHRKHPVNRQNLDTSTLTVWTYKDFYSHKISCSTGHSGKHGHEFLEFEFSHGRLRYANNSNYRNDSLIRKESEASLFFSPLTRHWWLQQCGLVLSL